MASLAIEQWPIERLVPYKNNPRKNDEAVPRMVAVIREFGFRVPLLAKSNGDLVDGHLRLKAARAMGLDTVPVITVDDLSAAQVRAFRIMINRSATWAEWDDEALLRELQALQLASYDLSLTGFDQRELDEMLMQFDGGTKNPDDIPEPPDEPQVRDGEVWLLGRHRLMCGDSTSRADMRRLMEENLADMIWTDPPYNVNYSGKAGTIKNDKMSAPDFDHFLLAVHRLMFQTVRPGGGVYVAHSEAGDGMPSAGRSSSPALSWPPALSGASKAPCWAAATTIFSTSRFSTAGVPGPHTAGMATASRRRSTNPASMR